MDKQEKEYSSLVKNLLILNELIVQNSMNFRLIHLWIDKAKPKKKKQMIYEYSIKREMS